MKGAGEIGFTIVSISLSLVAVFIPLFLMGGIVGRLFREFGITVSVTILVSMLVSLTLTPMMCSRFMRSKQQVRHGRLFILSEQTTSPRAGEGAAPCEAAPQAITARGRRLPGSAACFPDGSAALRPVAATRRRADGIPHGRGRAR